MSQWSTGQELSFAHVSAVPWWPRVPRSSRSLASSFISRHTPHLANSALSIRIQERRRRWWRRPLPCSKLRQPSLLYYPRSHPGSSPRLVSISAAPPTVAAAASHSPLPPPRRRRSRKIRRPRPRPRCRSLSRWVLRIHGGSMLVWLSSAPIIGCLFVFSFHSVVPRCSHHHKPWPMSLPLFFTVQRINF
jgi:hypothetical protein